MEKLFWKSKTFWTNIIALAAVAVQAQFGYILLPEGQFTLLCIINIILRKITKEEIIWKLRE